MVRFTTTKIFVSYRLVIKMEVVSQKPAIAEAQPALEDAAAPAKGWCVNPGPSPRTILHSVPHSRASQPVTQIQPCRIHLPLQAADSRLTVAGYRRRCSIHVNQGCYICRITGAMLVESARVCSPCFPKKFGDHRHLCLYPATRAKLRANRPRVGPATKHKGVNSQPHRLLTRLHVS